MVPAVINLTIEAPTSEELAVAEVSDAAYSPISGRSCILSISFALVKHVIDSES
jgi:hypothetical protein